MWTKLFFNTMANIKSAIKRIRTTKRNTLENKRYSTMVKTSVKNFHSSVKNYQDNPDPSSLKVVSDSLSIAFSKIDKAAKKRVLHKGTAARKKSRLMANFKKLAVS